MIIGWAVLLGVVCSLLAAGVILLASSPPRGNLIPLLPPPTPIPIQVHVDGEVENLGVFTLADESRLQDTIDVAGGCTEQADETNLNPVSFLQDGQGVWLPSKSQSEALAEGMDNIQELGLPRQAPSIPITIGLINIDTSSQTELGTLSGIGPETFEDIKDFITMEDQP